MFERLKKIFTQESPQTRTLVAVRDDPVSEWAETKGLSLSEIMDGNGFALSGVIGTKPWKLERAKSSRDYIRGEELRARAELKVSDEVSMLIMNRPLKDALEKRAYAMYTNSLQTTAGPDLPEEVRWLALYREVGWDSLPNSFWSRYCVLAEQRSQAQAWINPELAGLLSAWPNPGPDAAVPFMVMLLRGKVYLRMQYTPADLPTLEHAVRVFTAACESAVAGFSTDITL